MEKYKELLTSIDVIRNNPMATHQELRIAIGWALEIVDDLLGSENKEHEMLYGRRSSAIAEKATDT